MNPNSPDPARHPAPPVIALPAIPALAVGAVQGAVMMPDGEIRTGTHDDIFDALFSTRDDERAALVVHAPLTRSRLGDDGRINALLMFDVLELFAFVHPARFCVPTPYGLCRALGVEPPATFEDSPFAIFESARALLGDLAAAPDMRAAAIARAMGGHGWVWAPFILSALGQPFNPADEVAVKPALSVWRDLPEWSESAPPPPPDHHPVTGEDARARLSRLLDTAPHKSEPRPEQVEYTTRITAAFAPAQNRDQPHVVLAEAGTGVGKTLGYIAPASLWAEMNGGSVWISTYTKNLQRQIDQELDRLYPDPDLKNRKVAVRKGRENYLCLLNFEDLAAGAALAKTQTNIITAGLMARWIMATRDGDLTGGDFPGWLGGLLGLANTTGLADRRGECVYAACDHYHRCFVERAVRKSRHAEIVVANHALVMIQTALAWADGDLPQRYIFDEGHHLFDAADSAFAAHLTGWETAELRRWILGPEQNSRRTRARGLKRRVEDLIAGQDEALHKLEDIMQSAHALPAPGWTRRLRDRNPHGAAETFLMAVYDQVLARAPGRDSPYSLEAATRPVNPAVLETAAPLKSKLQSLQKPMLDLATHLRRHLEAHSDTLDSDTRKRLDALSSGLIQRGQVTLGGWIAMLDTLAQDEQPGEVIDWMGIERSDGQGSDVGLYRHWLDPMQAFAAGLRPQAHGIAVTSATLRDGSKDDDDNGHEQWIGAMARTGATLLSDSVQRLSVPSPFDYGAATRALVITDVRKDDMAQVAAAYRALFTAAGGGALGLFTAISRLRAVYDRIHLDLDRAGLPLFAQHVDSIDTGTLVDIFRAERHACLLGTDAVRDGVDVPGDSLRLLVYDRVPWPRPTILHKARRDAFGGKSYDEMLTRMRLRQAFGRLIRRADDRGVFVMLDSALPTRLHGAFPDGVSVERMGLADAVVEIKNFLSITPPPLSPRERNEA